MERDPYRRVAGLYDRMFESMNKGLRVLGVRLYIPPRGGSILDVGCGTGVHLETYSGYKCELHGIDTSPSMLKIAGERLGNSADLRQVDATKLPYEKDSFDLIFCMLVLHEMDDDVRSRVLSEMKRVLKGDGRILLIDFHSGRPLLFKGWYYKLVILCSEIAAGRRHFSNYRHYTSIGGLPALIDRSQLVIDKSRITGNNTLALYLLRLP
jgi:ubiquinone/menaquinone biosynthesis C-methylase UbiE